MTQPRRERFNPGRWEVQREREQLGEEARPVRSDRTDNVARVMPTLMKQLGVSPDFWQERLTSDWPGIVGPALARNTRPGRLEGVSLTVYVTNSVWLRELKQVGYNPLLDKLQQKYGPGRIRHLKLQLDPDVGRPGA